MENGDRLQDADTKKKACIQEQDRIKEEVRIKEEGGKGFQNPSDFAVDSAEHDDVCINLAGAAFIYAKS